VSSLFVRRWIRVTAGVVWLLVLTAGWPTEVWAGKKDPYPAAVAPWMTLVDGGSARAVIVGPQNPSAVERRAIRELVDYVGKITGVELPIVHEAKADSLPILIGAPAREALTGVRWDELGDDGFALKSDAEGIRIAGAKDLGTLYGVYHLLEKHLGVRWFMPGELGEVVPRSETLKVGSFEETEVPSFRIRWIENGDWALRQKMNVSVKVDGRPVGVNWKWSFHTHFRLMPPEECFDEHPEWFAKIGKRRRRPVPGKQGQQLCTSNPELVEEMARRVIKMFDDDPTLDILALAPQDGGGFCQCKACVALDEKRPADQAWHARYSNRLATFNNEVAERVGKVHPDKIIKVGAYAMYLRVPLADGYRPQPNLGIQVCHTYSCNSHPIASETCPGNTKYFRRELEHWARISNHLFIYEYYNKGVWGGLPYYLVHLIREDMPYYHGLGAEAFFTQPAGKRWPACGLNHYIAAKLAWDVELDVDRLMDDFCEKFYGEAAEPMRTYWQTLEDAFAGYDECLSPYGRKWTTLVIPEIFTPRTLSALDAAVTEAEHTAGDDLTRRRVRLIRARLDFTKRTMEYLAAVQAPFKGIDLGNAKAVAAAHKKAIKLGEPLSEELKIFARKNGIETFPRLVEAHKTLRFLVDLPGRKPILR
jgi:uncharacterized protein DUF4838/glycosyl hydrolase family 67